MVALAIQGQPPGLHQVRQHLRAGGCFGSGEFVAQLEFAFADTVVDERRQFLARGLVDQGIGIEGAPNIEDKLGVFEARPARENRE
jgi:hypothetical protein